MNKVSNHLSLFTIREHLIFEVASLKTLPKVSNSLSPNTRPGPTYVFGSRC